MHQRIGATNPFASGRWSLIRRPQEVSAEESSLSWATQLLDRYGVVTRETMLAERCPVPWSTIVEGLKALEIRGEVQRGYYLRGLSGTQFARTQAVDILREMESNRQDSQDRYLLLSACDPANTYGPIYPLESRSGERVRFPRTHLSYLIVRGGRPILLLGSAGREITTLSTLEEAELRQALHALLPLVQGVGGMARPRSKLKVEAWDGESVVRSSVAPLLQEMGFQREPRSLVLWGFRAEQLTRETDSP